MDLYLFHQDTFQRHYNCGFYSVDSIPLANRQHPWLGAGLVTLYVVLELLYLPCLIVIWSHIQQSCYKFMFFVGAVDILTMPVCGLLTGLFAIEGAVYCSHPWLMFYAGVYANSK